MTRTPREQAIAELIQVALTGDEDDNAAWEAIAELHRRGGEEVFTAACELLRSESAKRRGRGADILAQLGKTADDFPLRERCATAVLGALPRETESTALTAMSVALGHFRDSRAVDALLPLASHPDAEVRYGVVFGLLSHSGPRVAEALIQLSGDRDLDVRNWATFGLGDVDRSDSPALREALVRRLDDEDDEVRGEALLGLAKRHDPRVMGPLRRELADKRATVLALEAAEELGDRSLLPLLVALQSSSGPSESFWAKTLQGAIAVLGGARRS